MGTPAASNVVQVVQASISILGDEIWLGDGEVQTFNLLSTVPATSFCESLGSMSAGPGQV
jgi:hypothetical protein